MRILADLPLLDGWLPITVQIVAGVALLGLVRWRKPVRSIALLVVASVCATAVTGVVYAILESHDLSPETGPLAFWVWLFLTVMTVAMFGLTVAAASWTRRAVVAIAGLLTVLCVALTANQWAGFYPDVGRAWSAVIGQSPPNETSLSALRTLRGSPQPDGRTVAIDVPHRISGFEHRTEYVYLPPAWFTGAHPPPLPAIALFGGVINTPLDWAVSGEAITTDRRYAAAHNGFAPILVFVDPSGSFTDDTECVDGPHGNVDTRITREVRPYVVRVFGARPDARGWAAAGWSMGGTCAVDLAVEHPSQFATFLDISGDVGPNLGDHQQTVDRLYGGRGDLWARFDPRTAIRRHGSYLDSAGWFDDEGHVAGPHRLASSQIAATNALSSVSRAHGIATIVTARPGRHCWPFAAEGFRRAFPWLAHRLLPGSDRAGSALLR